ncbi:TrbM/KikA/MpfK family conjugal transfer protein [Lonsdalea quercina]|uniref:TrbM/KikA/MpfK family conjugal transfer protein n=1 Tax=Lonsdalea quercina TaxID=71657 RepID=UPI003975FFD5
MKKILIASVVILVSSYSVSSYASDPCKTLACMAAKSGGEFGSIGDSDCSGAVADFFNIVKKNKHGFQAGKTSDARKQFLMECSGAEKNDAAVKRVISMFGTLRG